MSIFCFSQSIDRKQYSVGLCGMGDREIERVFVARRPLPPGTKRWEKYGKAAHSALLLRTVDGKYYILEYMEDSAQVLLYDIVLNVTKTIHDPPNEEFELKGIEWTKQLYGKPLSGWTLDRVRLNNS